MARSSKARIKHRSSILESLEDRRLLFVATNYWDTPYGCDCSCSCGGAGSASVNDQTGNIKHRAGGTSDIAIGGGTPSAGKWKTDVSTMSVHNSNTNPHPIIRVPMVLSQSIASTDYLRLTLTILTNPNSGPQSSDPKSAQLFLTGTAIAGTEDNPATELLFTFQVDSSSLTGTGRYKTSLFVEYFHSANELDPFLEANLEVPSEVLDGPEVNILKRTDSEFGNRWGFDGLDQIFYQDGTNGTPKGALFVEADGRMRWYAQPISAFSAADGDPEFATLTLSSGVYTHTTRDGTVRTFTAAKNGKIATRTDADGNTFVYDQADTSPYLIEKITDPAGRDTTFAFSSGRLQSVTDYLQRVTNYNYESRTLGGGGTTYVLTSIQYPDPDGTGPLPRPETNYSYTSYNIDSDSENDFDWLLTSIVAPEAPGSGQSRPTTRFTYDFAGNASTIVHPDGTVDSYDPIYSQSMVHPLLKGTSFATAASFVLLSATIEGHTSDRTGALSDYTIDRFGYVTHTEDPSGYSVTYERNAYGQIKKIKESDPDGAGGPLPDNIETNFTYTNSDAPDGDLASISWLEDSVTRTRSFAYDGSHRLTTVTDELGRVTAYGYSGSSRTPVYIQQAIGTLDNIGYHSSTGEVEDVVDDVVWSFKLTTAASGVPAGLVAKAFDPLGRMTVYDYYTNASPNNTHPERWGQLKTITLPLLASGESTAPKVDYEYDLNGFVSKVTESGQASGGGTTSRVTDYLNDAFGRLLQVTLPDPGANNAAPVYRNFYDGFGRLVATVDPDISISGSSSAPTASPSSLSVNVSLNAGNSEIDLTQYFSDDVDSDYALSYMVSTDAIPSTSATTPEVFQGIYLPSSRPGMLVLDTRYNSGNADTVIKVKAVDSHGNVSGDLTITVTVSATPEFILNSTTTNAQRKPSIASTPDGGFVAAWLDKLTTDTYNLVARVFGPDGRPTTSAIAVKSGYTGTSSSYFAPGLTVTEEGYFVVAWHEYSTITNTFDVFYSRYKLDGTADSGHQAAALASITANDQYVPVLSALPGGGFLAVFYGGDNVAPDSDVWFRRFGSDGNATDTNQIQANNTSYPNAQYLPSADVTPDGSFVIAWQGNGPSDSNGAFARKFGSAGTALLTEESLLYSVAAAILDEQQLETDVAALADGTFVIVWASDETDGATTNYDVFYRRMDVDGALVSSRTQVNVTTTGNQEEPAVAALPNGGFVVTWHGPDSSNNGVFARTFDSTYSAGSEFAVNVTSTGFTSGEQYFADVIVNPDGNATFAWEGSGTGDSTGIFARYYPLATTASGPFRVTNLEVPPVVRNKIDRLLVTFSDPVDFAGSVTTGDFTLTRPNGSSLSISNVYQISLTQVLLVFNGQLDSTGTYTIAVGTGINRASGSGGGALSAAFNGTYFFGAGAVTSYQYDQEGRVAVETDALGGRTLYTYTQRGQIATVTDVLGRVTSYTYDGRGLLTKVTLPDPDAPGTGQSSSVIQYGYYDDGSLKQITDANGKTTTFQYDTRHRLNKIRQPGSIDTLYSYTKAGELAVVTDPLGRMSTTTYDSLGRVVKSSYLADDATATTVEQESASRSGNWSVATSSSDASGGTHRTASGTTGSPSATADFAFTVEANKTYEVFVTWVKPVSGAATNAPYTVYNGAGGVNSLGTFPVDQSKAPGGDTTVFTDHGWYSLGDFNITGTTLTVRLTNLAGGAVSVDAVRIIESSPTKYEYDKASNLVKITDAMGSVTQQVFDNRNRRTDLYLPHPDTGAGSGSGRPHTSFTFNAFGDLLTLTDPATNVTTWVPDQLGRTETETVVIGGANKTRTYKYDDAGNLNQTIDRLGRVIKYSYDKLYRMTTERWFTDTNDSTANRTISYSLDKAGQLLGVTDRDDSTPTPQPVGADYSYLYDNLGRVTQSTTDLVGLSSSQLVFQEFAYDAMSHRTEAKASYGSVIGSATKDYKNAYVYDDLGRLEVLKQQGWGGNTVAEKYVDFTYNALGQFTLIQRFDDVDNPNNEIIASYYGYDNLGRLNSLAHKDGTTDRAAYTWKHNGNGWLTEMNFLATWNTENATYAYDKNGQLKTATRGGAGNESFTFDLNGNRNNGSYTTGSDNQTTADGTFTYGYDVEGNLTTRTAGSGATTYYTYDHRNRLVAVTERPDSNINSTPTKIVTYAYDAFDRRVAKTLDSNPTGSINRYEFYIWDGDDIVIDFVDSDGGTLNASLDKRYLWGPAVDQLLADETAGNTVHWMLADHQGTIRDMANNDGTYTTGSHVAFDSFGKILSGTPMTRFTYTGQEYDSDTGLYYYNARWYNPGTGKFMSKDPIGFYANDTNQYRYVGNSSTNFVDPSGKQVQDIKPQLPPQERSPVPQDDPFYDEMYLDNIYCLPPDAYGPGSPSDALRFLEKNWGTIFPEANNDISDVLRKEWSLPPVVVDNVPGLFQPPPPPEDTPGLGLPPIPPPGPDFTPRIYIKAPPYYPTNLREIVERGCSGSLGEPDFWEIGITIDTPY